MPRKKHRLYQAPTNMQNAFDLLPNEVLSAILLPFQHNEASLFVCLVCKLWYSIIQRVPISPKKFVNYFTLHGSLSSLQLARQILNDDTKFFTKALFAYGSPQALQWAHRAITTEIEKKPRRLIKISALGYARGGHLKYLSALHQLRPLIKTFPLLRAAASGGHLNVLMWLKDNVCWPTHQELLIIGSNIMTKVAFSAGKHGHLAIVKFLSEQAWNIRDAVCGAAYGGHLELLQTLLSFKISASYTTYFAAKGGHLELLKWLKAQEYEFDEETCNGAAEGGHLDIIEWLLHNGATLSTDISNYAARSGKLEVIKYFQEKGFNLPSVLSVAIKGGNLQSIKYLHDQGCEWDVFSLPLAAELGYFEIVKFALDRKCSVSAKCVASAAKWGHYDIVKYLIRNKRFDASEEAAESGELDILQLLYENGCEISDLAWRWAAKNGDMEMLKWLHKIGCKHRSESIQTAIVDAINYKHLDVLKYLYKCGIPFDEKVCWYVSRGVHEESEIWKWFKSQSLL